ncbi:MAG: HlyD family type I secretion periplasmic adaptor subunit [Neorhizobium sp.]|nr:HlyD family type I secretion periplasmic adaptor subunit [Neorhizobium sp.]
MNGSVTSMSPAAPAAEKSARTDNEGSGAAPDTSAPGTMILAPAPSEGMRSPASRAIRRLSLLAGAAIVLMVFGAGGWAATAQLSGAVIGSGRLVVEDEVKNVQHKEGGIVGRILVHEGSSVDAGEVLVTLDDTLPRANLAIVTGQIGQLTARRGRLVAERDGSEEMAMPAQTDAGDTALAKSDVGGEAAAQGYLAGEKALFEARKRTIEGQKAQLNERIRQIGKQTDGLNVRLDAKVEELHWVGQELTRVKNLSDQGLVQFTRLSELQRSRAELEGERGQLIADIARAKTQVAETDVQILQLDEDRRSEVLEELRDVDNKIAQLSEQRVAAQDQLSRIDIRAPQAGVVHDLTIHTVGGVVPAGETIMQVVPVQDALVAEARIRPQDIDQVVQGQKAVLRFSAFDQRTTPELDGTVSRVAVDLTIDRDRQSSWPDGWYTIRATVPKAELARLGSLKLLPGMPVELFLQTGERSALSYLVKPLADQIARAMREG